MVYQYSIVDAFTDQPFKGNPAAVVPLQEFPDDATLQAIATEFNLSETAFVTPVGADGTRNLRWFTPGAEVNLCGHATLATTRVLGGSQRYQTKSGELICDVGGDGWIIMDFPSDPPSETSPEPTVTELLADVDIKWCGRGVEKLLVQLASESQVREFEPNFDLIMKLPYQGVIITSESNENGVDFVSRFFAPVVGVPEDPVTGSAHCTLAKFWQVTLGKDEMLGYQASKRGGYVRVNCLNDRVMLGGQAKVVATGNLTI